MAVSSHPVLAALSAALDAAAEQLGVTVDTLSVERIQATEWPDSCLGVPGAGEACAEVVTPGYRIRVNGGRTYHADEHGNIRLARESDPREDTEIRLDYSIRGGVAGRSTEFVTDSTQLTDAEEDELRRLITESDFFNVPNPEATTVVMDGYTTRLWIAVGRRQHAVIRGDGIEADDTSAFRALIAWADQRTPPLFPRLDAEIE